MKPMLKRVLPVLAGSMLMSACQASLPPLETVDHVDLQRFMGDWYVIANIPTWVEEGAHNAVENYRLDDDGSIATTFTFNQDGFDGPQKKYQPRGFIRDPESNAEWGMQFVWPIKGDYRITFLAGDNSRTVVSRNKRDYVWLMARTPQISDAEYQQMLQHVRESGYDTSLVRKVPQQSLAERQP